jgi:hypothetical protein
MKIRILCLVLVLISGQVLANYPVDDDIADLKQQIRYLEYLKNFFTVNDCSITADGNKVLLRPDWLRGEGLVIAIDQSFAGNAFSYYNAPKPTVLKQVVEATSLKPAVDPMIVSIYGGFFADLSKEISFYVAKPTKVDAELIIYGRQYLNLKVPVAGESSSVEIKTKSGSTYKISCN